MTKNFYNNGLDFERFVMDLRKIFFATLIFPLFLLASCATTEKEPEIVYYDLTLTLMVDSDPYEGAARDFALRDISGEVTVDLDENGEEVVTGIYPFMQMVEMDDDGEIVSRRTDKYTLSLEEGEYRLYESDRDLNIFISVGEGRTDAVYAQCSSIDEAAKILKNRAAPSCLAINVKEKTYQTLGYDNLLQRSLASCESPVCLDISGCTNTTVGFKAFHGCTTLRSLVLPDAVTSIGKDCFNGCKSLRHVNIPQRVSSIEGGAFTGCVSLVEMDISPRNVFYTGRDGFITSADGKNLIAWPGAAGEVSVPESVESIGGYCFSGCTNLDLVNLAQAFEIKQYAFLNCTSLNEIEIPKNMLEIETGAFSGCLSLSKINIAEGNPSYKSRGGILLAGDNRKLLAWPSAQGNVQVPEGVTRIDDNAFQNQAGLKSISLSSTVKEIGSLAFSSCVDLTSVSMPSVVNIEAYAFSKCKNLKSLTIPESTRRCDGSAFAGCTSLEKIDVAKGNANYISYGGAIYSADGKTLVEWPAAKDSVVIADSVEQIGTFAFNGCSALKSVAMKNVVNVGHHAFDSCSALESVDLGNSVNTIGSHAFSNCLAIKNLYIPATVVVIKNYAFWFWGSNQTISCQPITKPSGWDFAWNADSDAKLIWGVEKTVEQE